MRNWFSNENLEVEYFVGKSKYVICFELVVQIMKIYVKLQVDSYLSHETGILLTWITKSIEAPLEKSTLQDLRRLCKKNMIMIKKERINQRIIIKNLKWKTDLWIYSVIFYASISMHNSQDHINYIFTIL